MANEWFESVAVARRSARQRLPRLVYGALVAGTERGITMADDEASFRPERRGGVGGSANRTA